MPIGMKPAQWHQWHQAFYDAVHTRRTKWSASLIIPRWQSRVHGMTVLARREAAETNEPSGVGFSTTTIHASKRGSHHHHITDSL